MTTGLAWPVDTSVVCETMRLRSGPWVAGLLNSIADESLGLGLRHSIAVLSCRVNPKLHRLVGALEGVFLAIAVRHAPGQFRYFSDKSPVFIAPIEDDFVLVHQPSPLSRDFRIMRRA